MASGILLSGALLSGCSGGSGEREVDFRTMLADRAQLQLAEMSVSKVGRIADSSPDDAKGLMEKTRAIINSMKIGTRIGVYSYDTYLQASVDLSALEPGDVEVDEGKRHVSVTLPPIEIDYAGRDMQLREEHSRVTGLRSQITPEERARLKSAMAADLQREVAADPEIARQLRRAAEESAREFVAGMAAGYGYTSEVRFRTPSHNL